jgi:uncharacterized protein YndB with AHSA1/START domain
MVFIYTMCNLLVSHESSSMEPVTVERTIWIATTRERAWQAVTDPVQLSKWYATNFKWEIPALEIGATVKFHNSETDIPVATIQVLDPPRQFSLRWEPDASFADVILITTILLTEENGGTRVTLIESGYEAVPENERQQWLDRSGEGYSMSVQNLKALLENTPLPY